MKKYNNLNIDIERNIFKSYSKAKITVHMIPATTFLETMGCNIPSIIYFDISVYKFNKKTLKIFDALEKNGIYYNSAKKASFFINSLGDDIESWWFSKKVQKARNVFCAEFAYFVENWENNWSRYFQSFS